MTDVTVVGCGFMGRNHAHAVADHPTLRLTSVVDVDEETAAAVAAEHGATAETEFDRAVEDADAVVVATPETLHADQARTVLEHDRHLLLEKPVTVDTDEAWALADLAEETNTVTGVSFILRYDTGYAGLRETVTEGTVGDPISVRAKRGITRGESERIGGRGHPLYYMNVHDIDAMRWVVGSEIREVTGIERRGELASVDVPDVMHATLSFENGAVGTLTGYGVLPDETPGGIDAALELVGTDGTATADTPGTTLTVNGASGYDRPDVRHWPVVNDHMDGAVKRQIDAFARAIGGEREAEPLATIRDGAHAQAVADAIYTATETGTSVAVETAE
ncbi:Gfo/Idh/MocA family protein [Halomicroarcula sp. GCM10025324]|uniref:Gfo/Idh/MocA family protein n=1 Tax=Haloarcula TaxID=2237 RepID=UPI0023E8234D|nr:Gfo/Idh/MocA family oxidoreductase [Halomicroarcula sp. ZS-22-S1]